MPIDHTQKLAGEIGIEQGQDIEIIRPYIESSNTLLELGCGYGRSLKKIREIKPSIDITAVDRNQKLLSYISLHFTDIDVIHADILNFSTYKQHDLVIMPWATICEFDTTEQSLIIKNAASALKSSGYFIFDIIRIQKKHPFVNFNKDYFSVKTKYGEDFFCIPSIEKIEAILPEYNLHITDKINYTTETNINRTFFIIQKH